MRTRDMVAGAPTFIIRRRPLYDMVMDMDRNNLFDEDNLFMGIRHFTIDPWPEEPCMALSFGVYLYREDEIDPFWLYDSVPVIEVYGRFDAGWDCTVGDFKPLAAMIRADEYPPDDDLAAIKIEVRPDADDHNGLVVAEYSRADGRRLLKERQDKIAALAAKTRGGSDVDAHKGDVATAQI